MKQLKLFLILMLIPISIIAQNDANNKVRILLIGDSTTKGGEGVFETSIESIINSDEEAPIVEVINSSLGGETSHSVVETGRYDKEIKNQGKMDFIFVRYGINDSFKRQPFEQNFPKDLTNLLNKLKADFPKAKIFLMTIIPYIQNMEVSNKVNNIIKTVAAKEKVELFDIYPAYQKALDTHGQNSMNIRFIELSSIPKKYHDLVKPYTSFIDWKGTDMVRLFNTELDPILGDVPGWYDNRHPNPMGYRVLAKETAEFLLPRIKGNPKFASVPKIKPVKLEDKIQNLTAPDAFKAGESIKVKVAFTTTEKRTIRVSAMLGEAPWTAVGFTNVNVDPGTHSREFTIEISKDAVPSANYKIVANILPLGKGWPDRLDEVSKFKVTGNK